MKTKIHLREEMACLIVFVSLAGSIAWILSCGPPKYIVAPISPGKYVFSAEAGSLGFSIPDRKPPGSTQVTIAMINPKYEEKLPSQYDLFCKSFSDSLTASLGEIIVAKGMNVKGPFENSETIPNLDKQEADLALAPKVLIKFLGGRQVGAENGVFITIKEQNILGDVAKWVMNVEGWISFEMLEPLSGERMWIKKIDLGKFPIKFELAFNRKGAKSGGGGLVIAPILYDTGPDALALSLNKMYPRILKTSWDYLNSDEMFVLKKKSEEIKKLKRY